jgi:preprotein translocase subunit SecD
MKGERMFRAVSLLVSVLVLSGHAMVASQEKGTPPGPKLADGIYAVLREGADQKALLPLKEGEAMAVDRHPYLPKKDNEPNRFLVVHAKADVGIDLDGAPNAVKEGTEVVRILLKLQPKAAKALEDLTKDNVGKQLTIVVGGEVVTTHKIREAIPGGLVQITSCTPGAANHLVERLQAMKKKSDR